MRSPSTCMLAGTSIDRTKTASRNTATAKPNPHLLVYDRVSSGESTEYHHHDDCGSGNDARRRAQPKGHRLGIVARSVVALTDTTQQEDVVVH